MVDSSSSGVTPASSKAASAKTGSLKSTRAKIRSVAENVHVQQTNATLSTQSTTPCDEGSKDPSALPISFGGSGQAGSQTIRVSRDEMNLAEFPLTVLSKRADPSVKTLEFHDYVKGKNGELINREWIITGADKFGLPTSSDDEVLLGLLKLTADDGLRNRKIFFTRYELLKILRWTTEGRSYTRLQNALDRLSGVRIKATNAFYDNESKLHSTRNFGIIDAYEINDGRDTSPSFFTWSDVLFKSFQVGFIKKLDLDFYLDLKSAVSKRLYRYLDKHFWYRSRLQVNLFTLAHEKIGVSRNYLYASSLRQQLEPALAELVERGMLAEYEFLGRGQSTEVLLVAAHGPRRTAVAEAGGRPREVAVTAPVDPAQNPKAATETPEERNDDPYESVVRLLSQRGLAERQVRRVIQDREERNLNRIRAIVAYFDQLIAAKSHLASKNPCGFLYRAIEHPFDFVLPHERAASAKSEASKSDSAQSDRSNNRRGQVEELAGDQRLASEARYLTYRKQTLDTLRATAAPTEIHSIEVEVEAALGKIRAHISPQRFREALEHGIEQRLLDRRGFPDYDKWMRDTSAR